MKRFLSIAFLLILGFTALQAQPIRDLPRPRKLEKAAEYLNKGEDISALEVYMTIFSDDQKTKTNDPFIVSRIADIQYNLRDYVAAEQWYAKLLEVDKENAYPLARFHYARNMKMNAKYDECVGQFQMFASGYTGSDADKYKKLSEQEILGAEMSKNWVDRVNMEKQEVADEKGNLMLRYTHEETINSRTQDASPVFASDNEMFFASRRADSITVIDVKNGGPDEIYTRIYRSKKGAEGWEKPEAVGTEINEPATNNGSPMFAPSGDYMFFTRFELGVNVFKHSDIYGAKYLNGNFEKGEKLSFNSSEYSCKHPALAKIDGKDALVFSSDMPGGQGGWDLWYAFKNDDGSYTTPLNLGSDVNTVGDEECPFYYDKVLFFSSTGHPGMGGYDIFEADYKNNGTWGNVENLGPGYNSSVDDMFFALNGQSPCHGFLVSNRPGTISASKSSTCCDDIWSLLMPSRCPVELTVSTFDMASNASLSGCTVQLLDESGKVVDELTNNNTNTVTFRLERGKKYSLKATKKNYTDGTGKSSAMDLPIDKSVSLTAKLLLDPRKSVTVRTFDGRDKTKLNGCTVTLYDASGKEITAKTDNNTNEFVFDLMAGQSYKVIGTKTAFIPDDESFAANDVNGKYVDLMLGLPMFDTIYFDFDKDIIRPDGKLKLDKAASVLAQYPQLYIEISGHTDGFGTDAYNVDLGNRRATNAMKYLIEKSVTENRMGHVSFGEAQLWKNEKTAKGSDNPVARGYNRRAVIRIINVDELNKLREADKPKAADKPADKAKPADKPADKAKPADKPADKAKPADNKAKPAEKPTPAKMGKEEANAQPEDDKKKG